MTLACRYETNHRCHRYCRRHSHCHRKLCTPTCATKKVPLKDEYLFLVVLLPSCAVHAILCHAYPGHVGLGPALAAYPGKQNLLATVGEPSQHILQGGLGASCSGNPTRHVSKQTSRCSSRLTHSRSATLGWMLSKRAHVCVCIVCVRARACTLRVEVGTNR